MKTFANIVLGLFCAIFGGTLLSFGFTGLIREHSAHSWPTTQGIVTASSVEVSEGRRQKLWCPRWKYDYIVDHKEHQGSVRAWGTSSCEKSSQSAQLKLSEHPIGSFVVVIYDPKNPQIASLSISEDNGLFWWFLLLVGGCFMWTAWLFLFEVRKK